MQGAGAADFVSSDDDIVDREEMTDDETAALVNNISELLSEEDSDEEAGAPDQLSSSQAMNYTEALREYILQQEGDCFAEVLQLTKMRHKLTVAFLAGDKQALITEYFVK
ncbi:hypothetical protein MRX96_010703 [Rhipicephalus microplus]